MKPGDTGVLANYDREGQNADGSYSFSTDSCRLTYGRDAIGKSLLIFTGKPKAGQDWYAEMCNRTAFETAARQDLLYLDRLDEMRGKTRVSGSVYFFQYSQEGSPSNAKSVYKAYAGSKVTLKGNGITRIVTTDSDGFFEVYDLPPGRYIADPELPSGVKPVYKVPSFDFTKDPSRPGIELFMEPRTDQQIAQQRFEIIPGGHAELTFQFAPANKISGRVTDAKGKPLDNVKVRLLTAEGKEFYFEDAYQSTGKLGVFSFERIPPGRYLLVINPGDHISATQPFRRLYWPGVANIKNAKPIEIGETDIRENINFRVADTSETIEVSGKYVYADGTPAILETIHFVSAHRAAEQARGIDDDASGVAGFDGSFRFRVLRGLKGTIEPELLVSAYDGDGCPEVGEYVKKNATEPPRKYTAPMMEIYSMWIRTPKFEVTADKDIHGLEIKLPINKCKKAEK
jgi:hypothetical protein